MEITVQELEARQSEIFKQRDIYEEAKEKSNEEYHKLEAMKSEHAQILEALGKTEYRSSAGLFSYKYEENYKLDEENKHKLFEYFKTKGIFNSMITVNHQKLNSWVKEEINSFEEFGLYDAKIDGVIKSDPYVKVSLRK